MGKGKVISLANANGITIEATSGTVDMILPKGMTVSETDTTRGLTLNFDGKIDWAEVYADVEWLVSVKDGWC